MSKVRIVQCLCPSRHCIVASAYETEDGLPGFNMTDLLEHVVDFLIASEAINPWCGICQSRDFHYEDAGTKFSTMEEAGPYLQAGQLAQAQMRAFLKSTKN